MKFRYETSAGWVEGEAKDAAEVVRTMRKEWERDAKRVRGIFQSPCGCAMGFKVTSAFRTTIVWYWY